MQYLSYLNMIAMELPGIVWSGIVLPENRLGIVRSGIVQLGIVWLGIVLPENWLGIVLLGIIP